MSGRCAIVLFCGCAAFVTAALSTKRLTIVFSRLFDIPPPAPQKLNWNVFDTSTGISAAFQWFQALFLDITMWGAILAFCFWCENHAPFPPRRRDHWDPDQMAAWTLVLVSFAFYQHCSNNSNSQEISNRVKAKKEWWGIDLENILKEAMGWTFMVFVLFQCYDPQTVEKAPSFLHHLFPGAYVWSISVSHSLDFLGQGGGRSWAQIGKAIWRPASLALVFEIASLGNNNKVMGTVYLLCVMELVAFVAITLVFRFSDHSNSLFLRIKLVALAVCWFLTWDLPNPRLFVLLFGLFFPANINESRAIVVDEANEGSTLWDWYAFSTQYHWCIPFGMVFALNLPVMLVWWEKLEPALDLAPSSSVGMRSIAARALVGSALLLTAWLIWSTMSGREEESNANNELAVNIFVWFAAGCIYFRTFSRFMRQRCLGTFRWIGERCLEAYVLHHHVLLSTSSIDGQAGLVNIFSPGWAQVNSLVVLAALFGLAHLLFRTNQSLANLLFSSRDGMQLGVLALLLICLLLSALIHSMQLAPVMERLVTAVVVILSGSMAFLVAINRSKEQSTAVRHGGSTTDWLSVAIGTLFIVMLGIIWRFIAPPGADMDSKAALACQQEIQNGMWFPINTCNEGSQSYAYREDGIASIGTCGETATLPLAWGWKPSSSASACSLPSTLSASTLLQSTLRHRNLTFVGDSMIRHLYHATCRQVGHHDAGAYNTSLGKWSDYSRHYPPGTTLEFRWAPYADQMISVVENVIDQTSDPTDSELADVLVVGGGAWDLLHHTRTEGNRTALDSSIRMLAKKLAKLKQVAAARLSIVWVEPTEINTWALLTEDKRRYMREDQMVELRRKFVDYEVTRPADFVLNGVAFTQQRVNECYDGVHYPFSVYDGGSQILLNAVGWLLTRYPAPIHALPPEFGSWAKPQLGAVALVLLLICVLFADSFFGFSYLAIVFVPSASPLALRDEAAALVTSSLAVADDGAESSSTKSKSSDQSGPEERDLQELDALLATKNDEGRRSADVI